MIRRILWERPPSGWKKQNTDGSCIGNMRSAGCGGIVRDDHGVWFVGFSRHIRTTNSFILEIWGLRDGLVLCSNLNIQSLIIELDARMIVDAFVKSKLCK